MLQAFGSSTYVAGFMDALAVTCLFSLLFAGAPQPPKTRDRIVAALLLGAAVLNVPALFWLLRAQGRIRVTAMMHPPVPMPAPYPSHWITWSMIASLTAVFTVLVMPAHQRVVPSFLFAAFAGELGAIGAMRNLGPREEAASAVVVLCAVAMLVSLVCFALGRFWPRFAPQAKPSLLKAPAPSAVAELDATLGPNVQAVFGACDEYHEPDGYDCG